MRLNIQTKLFINIAGLILVILAGVAIVTNNSVITLVEQKVIDDFRQTQNTLQKEQELRYDRLAESSVLIGENSLF
jgi:hypothetical protein